jgi:hypothetical protein
VPFAYEAPPPSGALRQGEILGNVWEHRADSAAVRLEADSVIYRSLQHPYMIAMTADCDLFQDHRIRFDTGDSERQLGDTHPRLLSQVLLCELFEEDEIREVNNLKSDLFRRIKQNQDERYHRLPSADIHNSGTKLPELFMDFHRTIGISPMAIYQGLIPGGILRVAVMPPIYVHDLMHRYFGFLSRVALPD